MTKLIKRDRLSGRFIVGRRAAEQFNLVESLRIAPQTARLIAESDRRAETGDMRRARISAEFSKKS